MLTATVLQAGAETARAADIQALEKEVLRIDATNRAEIEALKAEVKRLREVRGNGKIDKGTPLVADEPKIFMTRNPYHFGFSDATGNNTVELVGLEQIDTGGYTGYRRQSAATTPPALAAGMNNRRARLGVRGIFMQDWAYGLVYDFGGNSDTGVGGATNTGGIENGYITYNGFYQHGQTFPVAFDIGVQVVPWTLDQPLGAGNLMFLERPSSSQVAVTTYGGGDYRAALGARSNDDRYFVGAWLTSTQPGQVHTAATTGLGPPLAFLARATYNIYQDKANNGTLHIGFNYGDLFTPRRAATGTSAYTASVNLNDFLEFRSDTTSFLATGNIPANSGQIFNVEAAASYGNFFAQGEYFRYLVDTRVGVTDTTYLTGGQAGPTASFDGGYIQASYTFGGRRVYVPARGAYTGVLPDKTFVWGTDGWGALELAGRYSFVDLRSNTIAALALAGSPGYASLSAVRQEAYGAAANWSPNANLRFMLDYEHIILDKNTYVAPATKTGATIDFVGARSQFTF